MTMPAFAGDCFLGVIHNCQSLGPEMLVIAPPTKTEQQDSLREIYFYLTIVIPCHFPAASTKSTVIFVLKTSVPRFFVWAPILIPLHPSTTGTDLFTSVSTSRHLRCAVPFVLGVRGVSAGRLGSWTGVTAAARGEAPKQPARVLVAAVGCNVCVNLLGWWKVTWRHMMKYAIKKLEDL